MSQLDRIEKKIKYFETLAARKAFKKMTDQELLDYIAVFRNKTGLENHAKFEEFRERSKESRE